MCEEREKRKRWCVCVCVCVCIWERERHWCCDSVSVWEWVRIKTSIPSAECGFHCAKSTGTVWVKMCFSSAITFTTFSCYFFINYILASIHLSITQVILTIWSSCGGRNTDIRVNIAALSLKWYLHDFATVSNFLLVTRIEVVFTVSQYVHLQYQGHYNVPRLQIWRWKRL